MKRIVLTIMHLLILAICGGAACAAAETSKEVAAQAAVDERTCLEIIDLAKKYDATAKLPASVIVEGKPCPRGEAAICLLAVIEKVLEKCGKEGKDAVAQEDLEKLTALHETLKDELAKHHRLDRPSPGRVPQYMGSARDHQVWAGITRNRADL